MSLLRRSSAPTVPIPHMTLAEVADEHSRLALLRDLLASLEATGVGRDVDPELMARLRRAVGS